ncbi:MAG: hypothetical protein CMJ13_05885 [Pelagibacterales bacterium]|nr:hypothetical protein [Pelagibacterales bacterium]
MKIFIISFFLFIFHLSLVAENKYFRIGFIDLENDIRYVDWGRHPVDIRSNHSKENRGVDGAKLGIIDSKKLERITKTKITLDHLRVKNENDLYDLLNSDRIKNYKSILLDLNLEEFTKLNSILRKSKSIIFFNISDPNNLLRSQICLENLYHTYPSNMMKTDSIAQFLVEKKWNKTLLLTGGLKYDKEFSKSFKVSSEKFGVKIAGEKYFVNSNDPRAREKNDLSFLTKGKNYKSIFISDLDGEFALGVPNSSVSPASVSGSAGLRPLAWHWSYMRHGAPQVNGRFEREFGRRMTERDWSAWIAIKSLTESILRTKEIETSILKKFLKDSTFKVDGSKGISLNYRDTTKQLRQPIFLVSSDNWVTSVTPIESFQNRENNLDTIGIIKKEINCESK